MEFDSPQQEPSRSQGTWRPLPTATPSTAHPSTAPPPACRQVPGVWYGASTRQSSSRGSDAALRAAQDKTTTEIGLLHPVLLHMSQCVQ